VKDGEIRLDTAYPHYRKRVDELLGRFGPCYQSPITPTSSSSGVVFGFAFGYRMKAWSKDRGPADKREVEVNRIPGRNNAVLAEQARRLYLDNGHALYLQFEIADALGNGVKAEYVSKREDQGTGPVADEFIAHARACGKQIESVLLLAHRHHFERCRIILESKGITGLPLPDQYSGYDPFEAQPRVMSPEDFIVNDFVSMALALTDSPQTVQHHAEPEHTAQSEAGDSDDEFVDRGFPIQFDSGRG
jgi:hypothetical protein